MCHDQHAHVRRFLLLLAVGWWGLACATARADEPALTAGPHATRSQNVTINLINRLVERGVLTKKDAQELIAMAEADAAQARADAAATQAAIAKVQAAAASAPTPASVPPPAPAPAAPPPADADEVTVTYIPPSVKKQIVDEMKQDVLHTAHAEHWGGQPAPEWVSRLRLFGDVRFRYEGIYYPRGNDNTGAFPNFNAINTGAPFDISGSIFSPQYDVDQNRDRFRIRARAGLEAMLGEGFAAGLRAATGENDSPVTENQSLGAAGSGQGGNFAKYSLWLDRVFIKYETGTFPDQQLSLTLGRFDNPFFATSMLWADDLGFDGAVVQARQLYGTTFRPFVTAGAFPVFNTDLNFATNNPSKFRSEDKWLAAAQVGFSWAPTDTLTVKFGTAYYDFQNIAGKLSAPYVPVTTSDAGNTDTTRPAFAQKGNTYMALRNILPSPLNNYGAINQWQYFGLATPYREIAGTVSVDFTQFEPVHLSFLGEYVRNLAFNRTAIGVKAVNNLGPATTSSSVGPFVGGDTGWTASFRVGRIALEKRWDWNLSLGYRSVDSDAVVDGFCDSDFGGGGTNLKGFFTSANLSLSKRVWLGLRWYSADSIAGPTFKNDILQFDTNAKF